MQGRLIAIDFKKAFDSESRDFLFRTLSAFRFGPSFIQWIKTFYNNISSLDKEFVNEANKII